MNDEYKMLREEIDNNLKQMHQCLTLVCTGALAVLAYIFNDPNNLNIFVVIFAALVCVGTRIKQLLESNVRISTYIEVFLEPNIEGRDWEIRSHLLQGKKNSHDINRRPYFIEALFFRTNSPYFLLGIIMYILYIYVVVLAQNVSLFNILFSGIFNTIALGVLIYIARFDANNKHRDKQIKHWQEVKEQSADNKHVMPAVSPKE